MPRTSAARYLASALEARGVTHVFFVPTILSRTLAELDRHTGIARVMAHDEKTAAYMADGYARASGRVGVCLAQGIGGSNLAAGLRDPWMAHSPVVAFTGGARPETLDRATYQQIDDRELFRPVTKGKFRVDQAAELPPAVDEAFRLAASGAPGPAQIEIPGPTGDLDSEEADFTLELAREPVAVPLIRQTPDRSAIAAALERMAAASRPLIVAGGGCRQSGAGAELVALAERLQIPVATSLHGKALAPADHPLSVGVVGLYSRRSANQTLAQADLVIFVGCDTDSMVTCGWQLPPPSTPVVHIDINPAELGRHYPKTTPVVADARSALAAMLEAPGPSPPDRALWLARVAALKAAWQADAAAELASQATPVHPQRICRELTRLLPDEALVVADTGHAGMWTAAYLDLNKPRQDFIRSAGSLGWAFPASLGAKLAVGRRPVVCFTGDGGFWYHLGELETAVRWNISTVTVINNNQSLNQERDVYRAAYGGRLELKHHELWRLSNVNLSAVAEAIGALGIRVEKPAELPGAIERALSSGRPTVVEVLTDPEVVAPLAWIGEGRTMAYSTSLGELS